MGGEGELDIEYFMALHLTFSISPASAAVSRSLKNSTGSRPTYTMVHYGAFARFFSKKKSFFSS